MSQKKPKNQRKSLAELKKLKPLNSRLTPISFAEPYYSEGGYRRRRLLCECDCGNEHILDLSYFINGRILSCGCYNSDKSKKLILTPEQVNERVSDKCLVTVLKYIGKKITPSGQSQGYYLGKCVCGNEFQVKGSALISGNTKSCGCIVGDQLKRTKYSLRVVYRSMLDRCYKPECSTYKWYGAKGVKVCKEWKDSFYNFYHWAINNGWKPGLQLDKDILGNGLLYSPKTCKFVTSKENNNNRSSSTKYNYNGGIYTISEICAIEKVKRGYVYFRVVEKKMSLKDAIEAARLVAPKKRRRKSNA